MKDFYQRLEHFCSFQDRCTHDVVLKMEGWKVPKSMQEKLLKQLKSEGFMDDQRFAEAFVRGKFRGKRWGKRRILLELRARRIPEEVIREALARIDEEEYRETIRELIRKKSREINPEKIANKREKILTFVVGKGFEYDLVLRILIQTEI